MSKHERGEQTKPVSHTDVVAGGSDAGSVLAELAAIREELVSYASAPVVLVEYGDYECPHCGHAHPIVKRVQRHFGNRLAFIFRNFPLSEIYPNAQSAAETAEFAGASKGIGAGIARSLAAEGAAVVVNYSSSKGAADRVVADIQGVGGKAAAIQADVSRPSEIPRLFLETMRTFNRLDILVNNAGIYEFGAIEAITPQAFHKQFDLNVLGLLLVTQEAVKYFGEAGGSIVNISSIVARAGFPNAAIYSATKAAVDAITRVLAAELGPRRIRVNAVNPGMVATEANTTAAPESELRKIVESQTPLGRIGNVDDIAPAVVFLASDQAKWITGESLYITGGFR